MSDNLLFPKTQANQLIKMFEKSKHPLNVKHFYLDASADMKKYVTDETYRDLNKLGHPGICPSCKNVMEKEIDPISNTSPQIYENPPQIKVDLKPDIQKLKSDEKFCKNVFKEDKFKDEYKIPE